MTLYIHPTVISRSLINKGDTSRLKAVISRAEKGEPVTIGVIGGSITQGANSSEPDLCYANLVLKWWKDSFPNTNFHFVNAGIGATGSHYGVLRITRDLLNHAPDFVVIEYAVNDPNTKDSAETLEGIVRQLLKSHKAPALLLLFMMRTNGENAQQWLSKIGEHYNLPMISFRDALWPEIEAGRLQWSEAMADEVHPNDKGHAYAAELVTRYLEDIKRDTASQIQLPFSEHLPVPLISDLFERVHLYEAGELSPTVDHGWTRDTSSSEWTASTPGSTFECEVYGKYIAIRYYRIHGDMGRVGVYVDSRPPVVLDGWFEETWGGYGAVDVVARDLELGNHKVRIVVLDEMAPESNGHLFRLLGIGVAV